MIKYHKAKFGNAIIGTLNKTQLLKILFSRGMVLVMVLLLAGTRPLNAEKFGDVDFYLVDSLDLSQMNNLEIQALDSVLNLYHVTKDDTARLKFLEYIIESSNDINVWPKYNAFVGEYCTLRLEESYAYRTEELDFMQRVLAGTYNNWGYLHSEKGEMAEAVVWYKKSLKINEKIGNQKGVASTINNLGYIYLHLGSISEALEAFEKSLKMSVEMGNESGAANSMGNLAYIYKTEGEIESALSYYSQALEIQKKSNDEYAMAMTLGNLGVIYMEIDSVEAAIDNLRKSMVIERRMGNSKVLFYTLNNLAVVYARAGMFDSSNAYFEECFSLAETLDDPQCKSIAYRDRARSYLEQRALDKALENGVLAMKYARETGFADDIKEVANTLREIYEGQENWNRAYEMQSLFHLMKDSIINEENKEASIKQNLQYEYEKKEREIVAEEAMFEAVFKEKEKRNLLIIVSVSVGLFLTLLFAGFIYSRYRLTQKQKHTIDVQNQRIDQAFSDLHEKNALLMDSITYAKKLQKSILTREQDVHSMYPESFVLFIPKDIVSGDFFWLKKRNGLRFIAVVDCTGHGVPGAMLSVVSHEILNRAILEENLTDPGEILSYAHRRITQILHQESARMIVRDGFDISLVSIDEKTNILRFAGAHNYGLLIRNNEPVMLEANSRSIGFVANRDDVLTFDVREVQLQPEDQIYLFTDGYRDQFGEKINRKLFYKNFEKLLVDYSVEPMEVQKQKLQDYFYSWKGKMDQIDDVTVMGLKLK